MKWIRFNYLLCLITLAVFPTSVLSFTQHAGTDASNPIPMGHEWITRLSAIELLGDDKYISDDPNDPRKKWTNGKAKNLDLTSAMNEVARIKKLVFSEKTYAAQYKPVWDAIIGERWVDIGGNNFTNSKIFHKYNCLDNVTQEPADVQYDHYMRRYDDVGGQGGLTAANNSKERFIKYFVAAAIAPPGDMKVWDGGGYSVQVTVDRNYFLLGRALHLFEDSFSQDHTVRTADDQYEKVRQVKSYLCASGSEQHAHDKIPPYESGDVIWDPASKWKGTTWGTYKPSNIKPVALVAIEATKDVWAAFIRTMAADPAKRQAVALSEATAVAKQWLSVKDEQETLKWYADKNHRDATYVQAINPNEDGGNGRTQTACMKQDWGTSQTQSEKVKQFENGQRICLYNMLPTWGNENEIDPSLHLAYNWKWRNGDRFDIPPADWKISDANPQYVDIRIISRVNNQFMCNFGDWLALNCGGGAASVAVFTVPLNKDLYTATTLKVKDRLGYYLNRQDSSWGRVGIYNSPWKGTFRFEKRQDGSYNIKNTHDNQYMYLHTDNKPYINKDGKPDNLNAQWIVIGLPESYPPNGQYQVMEVGLKFGPDGVVLLGHFSSGDPVRIYLTRQADDSYMLKLGDN
ncbi:hypothetical protein [Candidatus Nitrotoga sp. M5]|uniref:hypothetical protein n=1 Tax=Candidatus Nitrotoga sp. M5 TaxID=2890409 RepID=UPI001EF7144E|nr:hypothetical protein [Candidatus Nitrotoga sp. M5]CAH1388033.1 Hemolysin-1 [Candidatus Nitrotoga sp. M5]